jgi:hypothetical protein
MARKLITIAVSSAAYEEIIGLLHRAGALRTIGSGDVIIEHDVVLVRASANTADQSGSRSGACHGIRQDEAKNLGF